MKRLFQISFVCLAIGFMLLALIHQWEQVQSLEWSVNLTRMYLSLLILTGVFFLDAYGWHLILSRLGFKLSPGQSIRIWLISSLARYIPGGIWSYSSRIGMAQQVGVSLTGSSISLYLETLLLMASSLAAGLPALMMLIDFPFDRSLTLLVFILLGAALHPRVIGLLRFVPGKVGRCMTRLPLPSISAMIMLYLYYVVLWILLSGGFVLFVSSILPIDIQQSLLIGASLPLSFFVGFVFVFAPGGLGVRESVLYLLLITTLTPAATLLISLGSRLWVMLGEIISLVVLFLPSVKKKRLTDI